MGLQLSFHQLIAVQIEAAKTGVPRMESAQSDSSGFADADNSADNMAPQETEWNKEVGSMGSSAESDRTFRSSITVLHVPGEKGSGHSVVCSHDSDDSETQYLLPSRLQTVADSSQSFLCLDASSHRLTASRLGEPQDLNYAKKTKLPNRSKRGPCKMVDKSVGTDDIPVKHETHRNQIHIQKPLYCEVISSDTQTGNVNTDRRMTSNLLTVGTGSRNIMKTKPNRVISHTYMKTGQPGQSDSIHGNKINSDKLLSICIPGDSSDSLISATHHTLAASSHGTNTMTTSGHTINTMTAKSQRSHHEQCLSPTGFPQAFSTPFNDQNPPLLSTRGFSTPSHVYHGSHYMERSQLSHSDFYTTPTKHLSTIRHEDFRCMTPSSHSACSDVSYQSTSGSSLGNEDYLGYAKLVKLINQPVIFKTSSRGSVSSIKYHPRRRVKSWTHLQRRQQLEEETEVFQHALQRYKTEMNVMETTLMIDYQMAKEELTLEEREEIEEVQFLWTEIRKEVTTMEQLLVDRMRGVTSGNETYTPLMALELINQMIELLKEQIYQQRMSTEREDDISLASPCSVSPRSVFWPEVSHQLWDIQNKISHESDSREKKLDDSLSELRVSILDEVRQEFRNSTHWFNMQLQTKDNEIQRLQMEILMHKLKDGSTRRRLELESDV